MPSVQEVIDLTLDSDDEAAPPVAAAAVDRDVQLENFPEEHRDAVEAMDPLEIYDEYFPMPGQFDDPPLPAMGNLRNVPLVIDDFGYLEEEHPQQQAGAEQEEKDLQLARGLEEEDQQQSFTKDDCLARVYEMFPDVCPEHALTVYDKVAEDADFELSAVLRLDRIIEKMITDAPYPKRKKNTQHLKRKRDDSANEDYKRWEGDDREDIPRFLAGPIRSILKAEFPTFTHVEIANIVHDKEYLFQSYVHLANLRDTDAGPRRGRPSVTANADTIIANSGWPPLGEELTAARKRAQADRVVREEERMKKRAEDDNLRRAIAKGRTAECQACFDDLPMNRQIHCHGDEPHFTCFSCIETYVKTEIGDSRCRVLCTAGCGAGFEPAQLNLISDKKLLQKLADLQQEEDIREANLDDLEECPFCDYKAIMPPIEENFEFHCANPDCEKVSCRRCKASSHIPISCEQFAKDKKANSRHTIEEAMTAALIRSCNKCKKQFIKEYGCNKMTCPSCRNLQCYVCSETLKGYDHFDQTPMGDPRPGGKCPLYDNLEQRHEREVKAAEEAARAQVIANNPDVAPEDLEIKLSDAVKKSTEQRIRRAGPEGLGGGMPNLGRLGAAHAAFNAMLPVVFPGDNGRNNDEDDDNGAMRLRVMDLQRQANRLAARRRGPLPRPYLPWRPNNFADRIRQAQQNVVARRAQAGDEERQLRPEQDRAEIEAVDWLRDRIHARQAQQAADRQAAYLAAANMQAPYMPQDLMQPFPQPDGNAFDLREQFGMLGPQFPVIDGYPGRVGLQAQGLPYPPQLIVPPAVPLNNAQQQQQLQQPQLQQPFQRGIIPAGFGIPLANQNQPMPDYLQIARDNAFAPAPADFGPNVHPGFQALADDPPHLANVARNMHQLEFMRRQHDARQGNARMPRFREPAIRRRQG
jgi:TRIAD3 protein (E3 ubiquitin-protein ligase RNF216)